MASGRDIHKTVYISKWMKDIITENTNKGMQYYVCKIKTVKDYYEEVQKAFPKISLKDIERVLKFG